MIRVLDRARLPLLLCAILAACAPGDATREPVTVFAAGSLARPLRAALDSIAASGGPVAQLEIMGSREMLRAVTALGRTPALLVTADADEMERALLPQYIAASTTFARNRVVLALSPKRRTGDSVTSANWAERASSGSLRIARTDPARAPLGYRTELLWQLAERQRRHPGLAARLAAASPEALMRGNESDIAALLESGDADAAWCYESLARSLQIPYVLLGEQVDFGSVGDSLIYQQASVMIPGSRPGDSVRVRGAPIRYAIAVMRTAPDPIGATLLRERLLDSISTRIMRRIGLDAIGARGGSSTTVAPPPAR